MALEEINISRKRNLDPSGDLAIAAKHSAQSSESQNLMVARMARGDLQAMSAVYKLFFNRLYRYGSVISPNRSLVEDAIQDIFIWLMEHPGRTREIRNLEIYLFQSLKRNLREKIEKNGRAIRILNRYVQQNESSSYAQPVETRIIEEEELANNRHWLDCQLESLPSHLKEALYLRFYEGLSYDEIAEIGSTTNQVARNYVSRALKKIRPPR